MKEELQGLLDSCNKELDDIAARMNDLKPFDKMRLYLTDYALIKACGTLEFVYRSIVADYFDQSELPQVQTYIDKTVRNGSMSATYENMCKLLGNFDDEWRSSFMEKVRQRSDMKRLTTSSQSLVTNRHQFAHGKSHTASFLDICQYYRDTLGLVEILDSIVNGA